MNTTPNEVLQKLILLQIATKELAVVQATTGIRGTAHIRVLLVEQMIQAEQKKNGVIHHQPPPPLTQEKKEDDDNNKKWFWWWYC